MEHFPLLSASSRLAVPASSSQAACAWPGAEPGERREMLVLMSSLSLQPDRRPPSLADHSLALGPPDITSARGDECRPLTPPRGKDMELDTQQAEQESELFILPARTDEVVVQIHHKEQKNGTETSLFRPHEEISSSPTSPCASVTPSGHASIPPTQADGSHRDDLSDSSRADKMGLLSKPLADLGHFAETFSFPSEPVHDRYLDVLGEDEMDDSED